MGQQFQGETRQVIVNAVWKACAHGGGWWTARDADGREVLLAADGFVDELAPRADEAEKALIVARARASLADDILIDAEKALGMAQASIYAARLAVKEKPQEAE